MKQFAIILLLVAAIVATIYNNERQSAAPVAPEMERNLESWETFEVEEPKLVEEEEEVPVLVVQEPELTEAVPALVQIVPEPKPIVEEPVVEEEQAPLAVEVAEAVEIAETVSVNDPIIDEDDGDRKLAGVAGDPHFKTWKNEHYEYHGQCDMVLVKDPEFANGLGLDIHIRAKLVRFWSYIQAVSIRIGNDIIELQGSSANFDPEVHYWFNYEYQGEVEDISGFPVTLLNRKTESHKTTVSIDLNSISPGAKILVSTYKEFLKVDFEEPTAKVFGNVAGMLGDFNTGKTLSRDGATVIDDFTDLGHEWQVLPADGHLFHETADPQYPKMCIDPEDPRGDRQRRLDEMSVKEEEAEAACAALKDPLDRKDCVYDILATQDLGMVGAF